MCGGCPTDAAGDIGLCLPLFALRPIPASAGARKPKQAQLEQCQGTESVNKEGGRDLVGEAGPGDSGGLCCKMLPALGCLHYWWAQRLAVGCFL